MRPPMREGASRSSPPPYDVIVVGAGPAGSTLAYDLARGAAERPPKRVALLEKATFPRDKYCGDAWCAPALEILEEMGILQRLEAEGLARATIAGGFVSPAGESFVSSSAGPAETATRVYAVKRRVADERIARRAVEVGADLHEAASVAEAVLGGDGSWTVRCRDGRVFRGSVLVAADGATSRLAARLGVVSGPAAGVAGRRYVAAGSHNFRADGVLFYPSYMLPGYVALFRHANDDLDLGCYAIPGGAADPGALKAIYRDHIQSDAFVRAALGPSAEFLEPLRLAPLRLGGVPVSYAERFLVVGDAAGHTDPLTGEGIHTAMIAARLAATTLHEAFARGEWSAGALATYQRRWMRAFGRDFGVSRRAASLVHRLPLLLDAANLVAQRKGEGFMAEFGAAMTGGKPKTVFLRPSMALPLALESVRQLVRQRVLGLGVAGSVAYPHGAAAASSRETSFARACLRGPAA